MENKQEKLINQAIEYYLQELYKKELNNEKMPKEAVNMYNILKGNVKVKKKWLNWRERYGKWFDYFLKIWYNLIVE